MVVKFSLASTWMTVLFLACGGTSGGVDNYDSDVVDNQSLIDHGQVGEDVPDAVDDSWRPAYCDDPTLPALFNTCQNSQDQESCNEAGGNWKKYNSCPPDISCHYCDCKTGQKGCPCRSFKDCIGRCYSTKNRRPGADLWSCEGVEEGMCSMTALDAGCYCTFTKDGSIEVWCAD